MQYKAIKTRHQPAWGIQNIDMYVQGNVGLGARGVCGWWCRCEELLAPLHMVGESWGAHGNRDEVTGVGR